MAARRLAWLFVGALVGLALLLTLPDRTARDVTGSRAAPDGSMPGITGTRTSSVPAPTSGGRAPAIVPATVNAAVLAIERGNDLHALAGALLDDARDGETEAQFSLAFILRYCATEVPRYADRAEFEESLRSVPARTGLDPELYTALQRQQFEACDGFRADPLDGFGTFEDWMMRAAASGHPLAELERQMHPGSFDAQFERDRLQRAARAALASGRPEALLMMFALEFPDQDEPGARDATPQATAWQLLACQRGYPCGPDVRWRREQLAFRGGQRADLGWEDALLFDLEPHEREQARERAGELARALDAGELEAVLPLTLRNPPP